MIETKYMSTFKHFAQFCYIVYAMFLQQILIFSNSFQFQILQPLFINGSFHILSDNIRFISLNYLRFSNSQIPWHCLYPSLELYFLTQFYHSSVRKLSSNHYHTRRPLLHSSSTLFLSKCSCIISCTS